MPRRMTPADRMPVLVGELNPYGADHFFALYCEPPTSSGGRLQRRVMALPKRQYLSFPRYNLCAGTWSLRAARVEAQRLRVESHGHQFVLLGTKVCRAFDVAYVPFTVDVAPPDTDAEGRALPELPYVVLPHPSGLCRAWNEPGAFERARAVLQEAFPRVPFGSYME